MAICSRYDHDPLPAYRPYYRAYHLQKEPEVGGTDSRSRGKTKTKNNFLTSQP